MGMVRAATKMGKFATKVLMVMLFWMLSGSQGEQQSGPSDVYGPISEIRYSFTFLFPSISFLVVVGPPIFDPTSPPPLGITYCTSHTFSTFNPQSLSSHHHSTPTGSSPSAACAEPPEQTVRTDSRRAGPWDPPTARRRRATPHSWQCPERSQPPPPPCCV